MTHKSPKSQIIVDKKVMKFLKKLAKSLPQVYIKIVDFLKDDLSNADNPCKLPNAKHLQGFSDNRYRWRLGDYRIIGIVEKDRFFIIQIIKIAKRDNNTYKDL
ncbi:type II toxin-antitoxin system RelE family toxin [Helicobacter sp. T3_23-1056]